MGRDHERQGEAQRSHDFRLAGGFVRLDRRSSEGFVVWVKLCRHKPWPSLVVSLIGSAGLEECDQNWYMMYRRRDGQGSSGKRDDQDSNNVCFGQLAHL